MAELSIYKMANGASNVYDQTYGNALHIASMHAHSDTVMQLLYLNLFDVNFRNVLGRTPIFYAVERE